jgi:hypothetical protein
MLKVAAEESEHALVAQSNIGGQRQIVYYYHLHHLRYRPLLFLSH